MQIPNFLKKKRYSVPLAIIFLDAIFLLYLFFGPITVRINSSPKLTYVQSLEKFNTLSSLDNDQDVNPICKSILMDHGYQTTKAIVFYHGFTNCPEQFRDLGQMYFDLGYNVLIPRFPKHGLKDRLTNEPSNITPQEISDFTDQTMQIISGLGQEITTSGISGGGTFASIGAYYYPYVKKALIISPLYAGYDLPLWALGPFSKVRNFMPDYYRWWDLEKKETIPGPQYAYPRFSLKAVMSFQELSNRFMLDVESDVPAPNSELEIIHVYSENDIAVKNGFNEGIMKKWSDKSHSEYQSYMFTADQNFNHDIIDKNQTTANTDLIYPILISLSEGVQNE